MKKDYLSLPKLNHEVVHCRLCPRLVEHRETVSSKGCPTDQEHWRKPIPGFGDPDAWLLLLGLAPSPQGGNRTGRIFTGDLSAKFLIKALHKTGFANQPTSESIDDGLVLTGCYITASVKCVPPKHRPARNEVINCRTYIRNEILLLKNLRCVLALGGLAFESYLEYVRSQKVSINGCAFAHGAKYEFEGLPALYGSFHPSPQNTNTGKMTEEMFIKLLKRIQSENNPNSVNSPLH